MGKKNPIKQVVNAATEVYTAPYREGARAIGADGIVGLAQGAENLGNKIGEGAIDLANNEKGKQQKKADAANAEAEKKQGELAAMETSRVNAANFAASEAERMSGGSKSRTLLTGPAGLDDEENRSITRRTLQAR